MLDHPLDVTSQQSVEQLAQFIQGKFDRLDVLVNNAGVLLDYRDSDGSVLNLKLETLQETMETNLYGPLRLCQALVPLMQTHNYGRIVNVSSGAGQLSEMHSSYPSYRMSKTALNALTQTLADELSNKHILVNAVCPGWVKTDIGGTNAPRTPEQGAETVVWLATLPEDRPRGSFFRDRQALDW